MDEGSFEVLFKENVEVLRNIAYRIVKDSDTAKDIVQQVFYKLWKSKNDLQINSSMRSYLHRAVINTALNHIEKHNKMTYTEDDQLASYVKTTVADPIDVLSFNELQDNLNKAIDLLPTRCQLVFVLSRFDGLNNKEIAIQMDTSVKTVENQMGKALKFLRAHLKPLIDSNLISIVGMLIFNSGYQWVLATVYLS